MEYKVGDKELNASTFLSFVNQVWQGDYDIERTKEALFQMVIILEQLQSCLFFQNIKNKEWEVDFFNLQRIIRLLCYTLVHNWE